MKKYINPDVKFLACDVNDIVTASDDKISVDTSVTPDANEIQDYANF